jgi:hypothetical protein
VVVIVKTIASILPRELLLKVQPPDEIITAEYQESWAIEVEKDPRALRVSPRHSGSWRAPSKPGMSVT